MIDAASSNSSLVVWSRPHRERATRNARSPPTGTRPLTYLTPSALASFSAMSTRRPRRPWGRYRRRWDYLLLAPPPTRLRPCLRASFCAPVSAVKSMKIRARPTAYLLLNSSGLNWQRELKNRPLGHVGRRPQTSLMSFDDRTADGKAHAHPLRLSGIKGCENLLQRRRV
jgi:hypothetical protein